jgi:hypothetical protein
VLIICESSLSAFLLTALCFIYLDITLAYHLFFALAEYQRTQHCYFLLLLKPAAQKEKVDWNSSTRSSRLCVAPVAVPVVLYSLPLFRFTESHHNP